VNQANPLFYAEKYSIFFIKSPQISFFGEEMRDYRPAKIDSTSVKIPSLLDEPFERK
jgi:hypothetical protein